MWNYFVATNYSLLSPFSSLSSPPHHPSPLLCKLSLDNSFIRSDMMQMKDVWSVRASNVPRAGDSGVPNPGESHVIDVYQHMISMRLFLCNSSRMQECVCVVSFVSCISAVVMLLCLQPAEMECFELAIIKAQGEKGRFQSTKVQCHVSLPDL